MGGDILNQDLYDESLVVDQDQNLIVDSSTLLANDTDPQGDALTITSVHNASHGTVSLSADGKTITFTPEAGYYGDASFEYTVSDGHGGSDTATATVKVTEVPVTVSDISLTSVTEGEEAIFTVTLSGSASQPTHYELSLATGSAGAEDFNTNPSALSFSDGVTYSNGQVTVPAGVTSFTVSVATTDDTTDEASESFTLSVGGTTGSATIVDNDAAPTVSAVSPALNADGTAVIEGEAALFTVTLSNASSVATHYELSLTTGSAGA